MANQNTFGLGPLDRVVVDWQEQQKGLGQALQNTQRGIAAGQQEDVDVEIETPRAAAPDTRNPVPAQAPVKGFLPPPTLVPIFENAARKYQVPVNVLMGMALQESTYRSNLKGPQTQWGQAIGIMQYLPETARLRGINPYDPQQSIEQAARDIRERLDKGYSMEDAVREHFAGPNRKLWGPKTRRYGIEVLEKARRIGAEMYPEQPEPVAEVDLVEEAAPEIPSAPMDPAQEPEQPSWFDQYVAAPIADLGKQLIGGAYKGVGSTLRGIGKIPQIIGDYTTTPLVNKILGTDYRTGNLLDKPADMVSKFGENIAGGVSAATKEAIKNSTPGGDLFKPSTWTFGKDPSVRGYAALGAEVLGQMLPVIASTVATGGLSNFARAGAAAAAGGAQGGGAAVEQAREAIDKMANTRIGGPDGPTVLEKESAYYRDLRAQGKSHEEAVAITREAAEKIAFLLTAPISAAGGIATSKIINPAEKILSGQNIATRIAGRAGLGALEEGTQEVLESIQTARGINIGAGTDEDVTENTFADFILGALGGSVPGAAAGALSRRDAPTEGRTEDGALRVDISHGAKREPTMGPMSRAAQAGAEQAQARRVVVQTPQGNLSGFLDAYETDEAGGFVARVLGDDGQVYQFTQADQVAIRPEQDTPALPPPTIVVDSAGTATTTEQRQQRLEDRQAHEQAMARRREELGITPDIERVIRSHTERTSLPDAVEDGQRVAIVTRDGEVIEGTASGYTRTEDGARITLVDADGNAQQFTEADISLVVPQKASEASSDQSATGEADAGVRDDGAAGAATTGAKRTRKQGRGARAKSVDAGPAAAAQEANANGGAGLPGADEAADAKPALSQPNYGEMLLDELIERRKYLSDQARVNKGWDKRLLSEKKKVENAIRKLDPAALDQFKSPRERKTAEPATPTTPQGKPLVAVETPDGKRVFVRQDQYEAGQERLAGFDANGKRLTGKLRDVNRSELRTATATAPEPAPAADDPLAKTYSSLMKAQSAINRAGLSDTHQAVPQGEAWRIAPKQAEAAPKAEAAQESMPIPFKGETIEAGGPTAVYRDWLAGAPDSEVSQMARLGGLAGLAAQRELDRRAKPAATIADNQAAGGRSADEAPSEQPKKESAQQPAAGRRASVIDNSENRKGEHIVRAGDGTNLATFHIGKDGRPVRVKHFFEDGKTRRLAEDAMRDFLKDRAAAVSADAHRQDAQNSGRAAAPEQVPAEASRPADSASEEKTSEPHPLVGKTVRFVAWGNEKTGVVTSASDDSVVVRGQGGLYSVEIDRVEVIGEAEARSDKAELTPDDLDRIQFPLGDDYRIVSRPEKNSVVIAPRKIGALYTDDDFKKLAAYGNPFGFAVIRHGEKRGYAHIIAPPISTYDWIDAFLSDGGVAEAARKQRAKEEADAKRKEDAQIEEEYRNLPSSKWIDENLGPEFTNLRNRLMLARVLDGVDTKFRGLMGRHWIRPLERLGFNPDQHGSDAADAIAFLKRKYAEQTKPKQEKAKDADPFANNKIFTADKVEAARARLRSKLGQLNSGIDPEVLIDGMTIAGAYIESGVRNFTQYAKAMIEDLGDGVKPYLLSFWEGARNYPGLDTKGMTSVEESARLHAELMAEGIPASEAAAVGTEVAKPAKRAKKTGRPEDRTLTQDWGVDHIDGYSDSYDRETGNGVKDAFLKETATYLRGVSRLLEQQGFIPHDDAKGRPMKSVHVNESGVASSGEVSLTLRHPETGVNVYAHIGETALRGVVPVTPSGIAVMYRVSTQAGDTFATKGTNRWAPTDLSVADFAALIAGEAAGRTPSLKREAVAVDQPATQEIENANGPQTLDQPGQGALEGVPSPDGQGTQGEGQAGRRAARSGREDARGDERAGSLRDDNARGMGDGAGAVSVPAAGAREGRAAGERSGTPVQRGDAGDPAGAGRDGGVSPSNGLVAEVQPENFTITEADEIGKGGAKTKYRQNVAAIRLLKELEEAGRPATRDEQAILAKYVGWGGLPQAFERDDGSASKGWEKEVAELKALLTPEEYSAAASSSRNAHYTSTEVVSSMWSAVRRLGFSGGRVLEPSVGVGNFFGLMPHELRKASALNGVELDRITSGIAKHLYPDAKIARMGFQEYLIPDGYFDLAIGNPPFGRERLYDGRRKDLSGFSIHNYFFAKSIDALRPGGILAMVVTNRFLDVPSDKARAYIAERADLIAAIRLPNDAFAENAGTEVTTDIIFLRKRAEGEQSNGVSWAKVVDHTDREGRTVPLNEYFASRPENMLGEFGAYGSMYSDADPALIPRPGQDTRALLEEAIARLPEGIMTPAAQTVAEPETRAMVIAENIRVGSMFVQDGQVFQREEDILGEQRATPVTFPSEKAKERVMGMIRIRDTLAELRGLQLDPNATEARIEDARARLNKVYDAFVKANGPINLDANKRLFRDDPTWPQISALEDDFDKGVSAAMAKKTGEDARPPSAKKAAIFSRRTQSPYRAPDRAASARDALVSSLSETGRVDLDYMARLYGKPAETIIRELGDLVYQDPAKGWVTADEYLSGNVKAKLAQAKAAGSGFERNVDALLAVQPPDIDAVDISVKVGAPWIPANHMADFAKEIAESETGSAFYNPGTARWSFPGLSPSVAAKARFGTERVSVREVLEAAASQRPITVYDNHKDGSRTVNEKDTQQANDKVNEVKEAFDRWIWRDDARRAELTRIYNDLFNTNVPRRYDGSHLTLPGKVGDDIIKLRPHQLNAVWRAIQGDPVLLDHVVGAGKTFTVIAAVMELRRMGLAKKPMLVVPNHLVGQWAADFVRLYPGANILAATKRDFEKENRKRLFSRIATGDWDAVIVAHSSFGKVEVEPRAQIEFIEEQVADLDMSISLMEKAEGKNSRNVKETTKRRDMLREKIKRLLDADNKDDAIYWGELGIDALAVDEFHEFKNLQFSTSMTRVAGLGNPAGSQKAADMFLKIRQVMKATGGRNIITATGTPISNTMAEMYTMQRYMDYDGLRMQGLAHFDAWARNFGEVVTDWELSPAGKYKLNSRFAKFVNMPELMQRYTSFADVITRDDINRMLAAQGKKLPVPKVKGGKPENIVVERSPEQARYIGEPILDADGNETDEYPVGSLVWRSENLPKRPEKGADNMLKIMSDARKAALDMRLIDPTLGDYAGSKVNVAADRIRQIWEQWAEDKGTQLVFIDLSTPKNARADEAARIRDIVRRAEEGDEAAQEELDKLSPDEMMALESEFSVYDDLRQKLIDRGIPANEIAFIHDAKTELQKEELFGKVRSGRVRVLLGSTAKMGAGMNVQDRLVALHHLDAPWRPSDLEQREGRIIRQGNLFYARDPEGFEVQILRYATKQTLDSRMWQTIESKARFIEQVRKGDAGTREIEDVSGEAANAAEMKAAASGNPKILEEMSLRQQIRRLENERANHEREQFRLRDLIRSREQSIARADRILGELREDAKRAQPSEFVITVDGQPFDKRKEAGTALLSKAGRMRAAGEEHAMVGSYGDFEIHLAHAFGDKFALSLVGAGEYDTSLAPGDDPVGLVMRLVNGVKDIPGMIEQVQQQKATAQADIPKLQAQIQEWGKAEQLAKAKARHKELIEELKPKKKAPPQQPQEQGGPQYRDIPRVNVSRRLKRLRDDYEAGKIDGAEFALSVSNLVSEIEEARAERESEKAERDRVRGADWLRERFIRARRTGEMDEGSASFALWLIDQNPDAVADLGVSMRTVSYSGTSGQYDPVSRVITLFSAQENDGTAVHEILHHLERMMPVEVQQEIVKEYRLALKAALGSADAKTRDAIIDLVSGSYGDRDAWLRSGEAFRDGILEYSKHYQLANPSEFWAVNATRILSGRYGVKGSWIGKARRWISELIERAKGFLGLRSDAPVLKGLRRVLNGTGEPLSDKMLSDYVERGGAIYSDITRPVTETEAFKRWFGDSKVVDADGKPLVVYHGTNSEFSVFEHRGQGEPGTEQGFFFTRSRSHAEYYAESRAALDDTGSPRVVSAYLKIENPVVLDAIQVENDGYYVDLDYEVRKAIENGNDGLIIKNMPDGDDSDGSIPRNDVYVVFRPEQIKSATGNRGTFDPSNPDITYSLATDDGRLRASRRGMAELRVQTPLAIRSTKAQRDSDTATLRKQVFAGLAAKREATLAHPDIGAITISRRGLTKSRANAADRAKLLTVPHLAEIIRDGAYLGSRPAEGKGPDIAAYHYVGRRVVVDGVPVVAMVTLEEKVDGAIDYYNHTIMTDVPGGRPVETGQVDSALAAYRRPEFSPDPTRSRRETESARHADILRSLTNGPLGGAFERLIGSGRIILHATQDTLPRSIPSSGVVIQGFTDRTGRIHLVAENLTPQTAQAVLLHEAFHGAGEQLAGQPRWRNLMTQLERYYAAAQQRRAEGRIKPGDFWDEALRRVEAAQRDGMVNPARAAEEFGAYAIENYELAPAGIRKWVDNLIGLIKDFLARRFGVQIGAVTPAQLRAFAVAALRTADRAAPIDTTALGGFALNEGPMSVASGRDGDAFSVEGTKEEALDQAIKALDEAEDGTVEEDEGRGDFIGSAIRDMAGWRGMYTRFMVHPYTIASLYPEFTPVFNVATAQQQMRNEIIEDLHRDHVFYQQLPAKSKAQVNKVLELGRLTGNSWSEEQVKAGVRNQGYIYTVRLDDQNIPHRVRQDIDAQLTKPGDVVKLNDAEAKAYVHLRQMFDRALDKFRDQALEELGMGQFAGTPEASKAIMEKIAGLPDTAETRRMKNVAQFIADIEQAKRTGYVPFTRYGDYVVAVKERQANIKYVRDPETGEYLASNVPEHLEEYLGEIGAYYDPAEQAWRLSRSQRNDLEDKNEVTVYSEKIESGLRDMFGPNSERNVKARRGAVSEIPSVRKAIERIQKEKVKDRPNRRIVAFATSKKQPEGGVDLSTLDALAEVAMLDPQTWEAVRGQLAKAMQAGGFRKHFFQSANVPGYSADFERSIADYMVGLSGYLSRRAHNAQWDKAVAGIKGEKLYQYATKYREYVNQPAEELALLRQTGFFMYLAGNISTAILNMTQTALMTYPFLSMVTNRARVMTEMTRAYNDARSMVRVNKKTGYNIFDFDAAPEDVKEDLLRARDEGLLLPLQSLEVMGVANRRTVEGRKLQKAYDTTVQTVALPFTATERLNRIVTFIAANRLARKSGIQKKIRTVFRRNPLAQSMFGGEKFSPYAFAEFAVDETQFRMGKGNRPTTMRGIGTAIMQFKSFMLQFLEAMYRNYTLHGREGKIATLTTLGIMIGLSGLWGAPGADDLRELFEGLYKGITKKDFDVRTSLRKLVYETSGSQWLAALVDGGFPYAAGADMSRRIGMGQLMPDLRESTGIGWLDSLIAFGGVPADLMIGRPVRAAQQLGRGEVGAAATSFMPNFVENARKAHNWSTDGVRTAAGRMVLPASEVETGSVVMKAIGVQPSQVSDIYAYQQAQRRAQSAVDELKRQLTTDYIRALGALNRNTDPSKEAQLQAEVEKVIQEIHRHNESAPPDQKIVLTRQAIKNALAREMSGTAAGFGRERRQARESAVGLREVFGVQ